APLAECAALGRCARSRAFVGRPVATVRGRSEPAGRHLLRGPDIRCLRDGLADILVGSLSTRSRVCDRLRPLPTRPKCLPTVRSPSARGGAGPLELGSGSPPVSTALLYFRR